MKTLRTIGLLLLLVLAAAGGWWYSQVRAPETGATESERSRVAVEAAPVTTGTLTDRRSFTGTLEAHRAFTLAPKTAGQVEQVTVDIGDRVTKGDVVVVLDNDEAKQAVAGAEAELALARAELNQAEAEAELARRELDRTERLTARDMASQSELDTARAEAKARKAAAAVAEARVQQRLAALERARVQLGYTRVRTRWPGDDPSRLVAARMVDPGDSVGAREPLLDLANVDPLTAVIRVPEFDYPRLARGQAARITSRALPGRVFPGKVARIAPRFAEDSRRARVEVAVPNPEGDLTPGMFVNVAVTVGRAEDATLVPAEALARRGEQRGVYRVTEGDGGARVSWTPVTVGIETGDRAQIRTPADLSGRVVTLGQQMLEDGAPVIVTELDGP